MPSFDNPIPRPQLPFRHEGSPLRHLRDGDSIGREWQKAQKDNAVLRGQGNALSRLQRTVQGLKRPKFVIDRWHPFKIYNVPPQFCSSPADSWRTFRVRLGLVGWRTMTGVPGYTSSTIEESVSVATGSDGMAFLLADAGLGCPVNGYQTDQIMPYGASITSAFDYSPWEAVSVPDTGADGVTAADNNFAEFILNEALDTFGDRVAEFWIEIEDPNEGGGGADIIPRIKCRMCTFDSQPVPRPTANTIYATPNIIPIGTVIVRRGSDEIPVTNTNPEIGYRVQQFIYDHQIARYPLGYYGSDSAHGLKGDFSLGGMIYRGHWTDDALDDSTFYPGDVVSETGFTDGSETTIYRGLYIYNTSPQNSPSAPPKDGDSTWRLIMYSEYAA